MTNKLKDEQLEEVAGGNPIYPNGDCGGLKDNDENQDTPVEFKCQPTCLTPPVVIKGKLVKPPTYSCSNTGWKGQRPECANCPANC